MKLTNISVIKDLARRNGFCFNKALGQNFLVNPTVCPRMAQDATGVVVEIGAGIGVLTRELAKTARKVIVVEIDRSLKPILAETLADCGNVEIIWGDIIKLDLAQIVDEPVTVVANLPYYAATHIIMKLLETTNVTCITVMVQEEVAQRFAAVPGNKQYGAVSVAARFYSVPELLFKVSRGSFMPSPKVDSAVIRFRRNAGAIHGQLGQSEVNPAELFRLVKAAFSERRKQLCNPVSKEFGIDKREIQAMLQNPNARAEELSLEEFIELYENFRNRNIL